MVPSPGASSLMLSRGSHTAEFSEAVAWIMSNRTLRGMAVMVLASPTGAQFRVALLPMGSLRCDLAYRVEAECRTCSRALWEAAGEAGQGEAGQGEAGQGEAGQGESGQDEAVQKVHHYPIKQLIAYW
eukprot:CAMPEP_0170460576 /NCGR_PEP_ID=MMETSP0123-20130129/6868_1 /TAXON_ID=182087 /ORGANISM="Favella ehrenbergii, Strain Fehren 1" /LENGTH=127 /DNA_ID=CAMNT_0010725507 /DNA_START=67 /DNA_END=450 /DNA_ORIENTATION=-